MNPAREDGPRLDRPLVWAAAFGLLAGAVMLRRSFSVAEWTNLGLLADRAFRISRGQTPYLDFFCPTTPLMYYALALWFKLFGPASLTTQFYAATQCAFVVGLTVYFCRAGLGFGWARTSFMGVLQSVWAPTMMYGTITYDGDTSLYVLLAGLFLFAADRAPARARLYALLSGAAAGLAFWSKQDIGAGAAAGAFAALVLLALPPSGKGRALAAPFAAGLGAIFGAAAVFFVLKGAFLKMLFWVFKRAVMVKWGAGKGPGGLSKFLSPFTTKIDGSTKYMVLLLAAATASGWVKTLTGRGKDDPAAGAVCLIFLGAFYSAAATHNGQGYTCNMSYLGAALALLWRQLESAGKGLRRPRLVLAAVAGLYAAIGLRGWHYLNLTPPPYDGPLRTVTAERLRGIRAHARDAAALDALTSFIRDRIPASDAFLTFDYNLVPYFASGRLCPLPFTNLDVHESSRELDEEVLIRAAAKPEVRWLLTVGGPEALRETPYLRFMPGLLDDLLKNFRVAETIGGPDDPPLTVWTRR